MVAFNVNDPAHPSFYPCSTPGYGCGNYTGSDLVDAAGYTQADSGTAWFYGVPQSSVSTVPEPAPFALLGAGLGALALALRPRRR